MRNHLDRFEQDIWASQTAQDMRSAIEFLRRDVSHVKWLLSMVDKRAQIHLNECEIIADINCRLKNIEEHLNIEPGEYEKFSAAATWKKSKENQV